MPPLEQQQRQSSGSTTLDATSAVAGVGQDKLLTPPPPPQESFVCGWEGCGQAFGSTSLLAQHAQATHVGHGQSSYTCLWHGCREANGGKDKTFVQRQKLIRHLIVHTGALPPHTARKRTAWLMRKANDAE